MNVSAATQFYDWMRHMVDSWGLALTMVLFLVLVGWPFLPGGRQASDEAARMIFEEDENG